MKTANHWCDLPLFTSDPPDTRITTPILAPPLVTTEVPKMLSPPIRWVNLPVQMTDENGSGGCRTALRASLLVPTEG